MTELNIGYARVSTDAQDLTAQRDALALLGVEPECIYVDHGLTGTSCERPGVGEGRRRPPPRWTLELDLLGDASRWAAASARRSWSSSRSSTATEG